MRWKVSIAYFVIVFTAAVTFGVILEKAGGINLVKTIINKVSYSDNKGTDSLWVIRTKI